MADSSETTWTEGVTVERLARKKGLPVGFLTALRIWDLIGGSVAIWYGEGNRVRIRSSVSAKGSRWAPPPRRPIRPYGEFRDETAKGRDRGFLIIVEGESDCWTLWHHGFPALGVPGVSMTNRLELDHVAGVKTVFVVSEPDKAGGGFPTRVLERLTELKDDECDDSPTVWPIVRRLVMPDSLKDPSDLHLSVSGDREKFSQALETAMAAAVEVGEPPPGACLVALDALVAPDRNWWPQLDDAAFYGLAGRIVKNITPHSEADPAALLFDLLVAVGNAIGPGPFYIADGKKHPARTNQITVGKTSRARKGTARANSDRFLRQADPTWAEERVLGGLGSGEGLIAALTEDENGILPDRRLLIVDEEFSRVLKVAARDGSILSEVIRQAFDGPNLDNITKTRPLRARNTYVSIIGHITVLELVQRLNDIEVANGFANRFLFCLAKRSKRLPHGGNLDEQTINTLGGELRRALSAAKGVGQMRRSAKANDVWETWYMGVDDDVPGLLGAITARAEAHVLRLSMIYALLDSSPIIEPNHILPALAVWDYSEQSVRWIHGDHLGDPVAHRLLEALVNEPAGLTRTEQRDLFKRHEGADRLLLARQRIDAWLRRKGYSLVEEVQPTGGRSRKVDRIAPIGGDQSD